MKCWRTEKYLYISFLVFAYLLYLNVMLDKSNIDSVRGSPNGTIGNFTNGTIGSQRYHWLTNGTVGLPMVPIVPLGEPMVPLALPLVQMVLLILYEQNRILTTIKGCNSATNFLKMTLYNHNLDLINVNVYTKFGLILFIL